jgi:hypothetical protein
MCDNEKEKNAKKREIFSPEFNQRQVLPPPICWKSIKIFVLCNNWQATPVDV